MLVRYWSVTRRYQSEDLGDPLPRIWTGASAGAVNALLGGLSSCDPRFESETWSLESSLFWRVWVERLDLTRERSRTAIEAILAPCGAGSAVHQGTPRFFRELELAVEGQVTFW
jgi:hypothetical protein